MSGHQQQQQSQRSRSLACHPFGGDTCTHLSLPPLKHELPCSASYSSGPFDPLTFPEGCLGDNAPVRSCEHFICRTVQLPVLRRHEVLHISPHLLCWHGLASLSRSSLAPEGASFCTRAAEEDPRGGRSRWQMLGSQRHFPSDTPTVLSTRHRSIGNEGGEESLLECACSCAGFPGA